MSNQYQREKSQNQDSNNVEMEGVGANQNQIQSNEFLGQTNYNGQNQGDKKEFRNEFSGPVPDQDMMLKGGQNMPQG